MAMYKNLLSEISTYFSISGEMIPQNGEDSYLYSFNENKALVGVFDGCGGIGSRRYEILNGKTGAYIASRIVGECVAEWFEEYSEEEYSSDKSYQIFNVITNALKGIKSKTPSSKIKGAMTKDFPTTLSMTIVEYCQNEMIADFIWAGDSRGYVLSDMGLAQVTKDDIDDSVDALDNISNDGVLTNVVSADGNYILHSKQIKIKDKIIIFNATDGCFGYLKTAMEFEYLILQTLLSSDNIIEWRDKLKSHIRQYTGDDHTISLVAIGFKDFNEMQDYYLKRAETLYEHYIKNLKNCTQDEIDTLWNEYKRTYYGKA